MRSKLIILLDGKPDNYDALAKALFGKMLDDPDMYALFNRLVNDPDVSRRELLATAFALGSSAAVDEMRCGHIKLFPQG